MQGLGGIRHTKTTWRPEIIWERLLAVCIVDKWSDRPITIDCVGQLSGREGETQYWSVWWPVVIDQRLDYKPQSAAQLDRTQAVGPSEAGPNSSPLVYWCRQSDATGDFFYLYAGTSTGSLQFFGVALFHSHQKRPFRFLPPLALHLGYLCIYAWEWRRIPPLLRPLQTTSSSHVNSWWPCCLPQFTESVF